jgi:ArsR family transcriptional regulator
VNADRAQRLATIAKALSDPVRVQLVDVLRQHAGDVCVCELVPLFDVAQNTISHHLKKLREAELVGVERRGLFAYYYVKPDALEDLNSWLS